VELAREAGLYLVQAVGWRRVERVVGLPAFDLGDRRLNAGTDEPHDPVGIAVGLGRMGPLVKIGVADEHDLVRVTLATSYGPVAGSGCEPMSCKGVVAGTANEFQMATSARKSGSGTTR